MDAGRLLGEFLAGGGLIALILALARFFGPTAAGILAALPVRLGATLFMGGFSQGSEFAIQMLRGSVPSSIGAFAFMVTLARTSKHGMAAAFIVACLVYAAIVAALMVVS